jgi:hypothetical protein
MLVSLMGFFELCIVSLREVRLGGLAKCVLKANVPQRRRRCITLLSLNSLASQPC